ncbi:MAG: HIT domain-containing protein [Ignavibacteria bacterium]|nr:HIT domain-containing protein [Ignavibacteria bacterium]
MEQLWSPWRSDYIQSAHSDDAGSCFLCACANSAVDETLLVVADFENSFVVLNKFPYNAGHLLIAPKAHEPELTALSRDTAHELMTVLQLSLKVTQSVLKPHGCNVGANLGRAAGAGVPQHLHLHIVPRWNGDTNFMPTIGDVKVISESVHKLWKDFSEAFTRIKV